MWLSIRAVSNDILCLIPPLSSVDIQNTANLCVYSLLLLGDLVGGRPRSLVRRRRDGYSYTLTPAICL